MLELKKITTVDKEDYSFTEELLLTAFPREERRELPVQRENTDHKAIFRNNIILDEGKRIGFISFWNFGSFVYVEHFAISPEFRNAGYGQKVLAVLKDLLQLPIVLEVELPTDDLSKRRIAFYQRQGFALWEKEYIHPPYREGEKSFLMHLMVYGNLSVEKDFDLIRKNIHTQVYLVKEDKLQLYI